jgi:signal transduction histidine kinase
VVEKGGIRRILMNLIGNSLKFTTVSRLVEGVRSLFLIFFIKSGFIKVMLREASPHVSTPEGYTRIEIAVIDTGKVGLSIRTSLMASHSRMTGYQ